MRYHPYTQCELDTQAKEYCAGLKNRVNEHRRNWPKEYIVSMKDDRWRYSEGSQLRITDVTIPFSEWA